MQRRRLLTAALVLAAVFGLGLVVSALAGPTPAWLISDRAPGPAAALAPSQPTALSIPALALQAQVRPVGLDQQGAIATPPMHRAHEAGWYEEGPAPGEQGAAVIVGHVDDLTGPAVFHELTSLRPGDVIEVTRHDGRAASFEVTDVRSYDKTALPPEVYGDFRNPELRLITCGGAWREGAGYPENVVVFARLLPD